MESGSTNPMRSALRSLSVHSAVIAMALLTSCASRPTQPAPPPKPIYRIAIAPAVMPGGLDFPADASQSRNVALGTTPQQVFVPGQVSGAAVGGALAGGLIAAVVANEKAKSKRELDTAMASIGFSPADYLNAQLPAALAKRGVEVTFLPANEDLRQARLDAVFKRWEADYDAVLDLRVDEYSYYHSSKAGGYSPSLSVSANLVWTANPEQSESFGYWSDWREAKNDPEAVTSPPRMTYKSLDALVANSDEARAGFEEILSKMADLLSGELRKRVKQKEFAQPAAPAASAAEAKL